MSFGAGDQISDDEKGELLEAITGYKFRDKELRTRAITRRAWVEDRKPMKEKEQEALATLGDAIINVIVLSQLIQENDKEGVISKKRDGIVNHHSLTEKALDAGLKKCIKLGKSEEKDEEWDKGKAPGESLESIIGAVYLDALKDNRNSVDCCQQVLKKMKVFTD